MAATGLQAESANGNPSEINRLHRAWLYAKAQWDLAENDPSHDGLDCDESSPYCDAEHEALLAFFLHPASTIEDVSNKLRVFYEQEGWHYTKASEIVRRMHHDLHKLAFRVDLDD